MCKAPILLLLPFEEAVEFDRVELGVTGREPRYRLASDSGFSDAPPYPMLQPMLAGEVVSVYILAIPLRCSNCCCCCCCRCKSGKAFRVLVDMLSELVLIRILTDEDILGGVFMNENPGREIG